MLMAEMFADDISTEPNAPTSSKICSVFEKITADHTCYVAYEQIRENHLISPNLLDFFHGKIDFN